MITIIIPNYNNFDYLYTCVQSIYRWSNEPFEILIVDNNSDENNNKKDFRSYIKKTNKLYNNITMLELNKNLGFSGANNIGYEHEYCTGEYIYFLNNDTKVLPMWDTELISSAKKLKNIGAISSKQIVEFSLKEEDLSLYKSKKHLTWEEAINYSDDIETLNNGDWEDKNNMLPGCCLFIPRNICEELKCDNDKNELWDTQFFPGYFEDDDLSLRIINLGYKLYICGRSFIMHKYGSTIKKFNTSKIILKNKLLFHKKHFIEGYNNE